eukprot:11218952-Lingulodinium_polyedra.AAC.1
MARGRMPQLRKVLAVRKPGCKHARFKATHQAVLLATAAAPGGSKPSSHAQNPTARAAALE